jgi:TPR repeat protein
VRYANGEGIPKDSATAVEWWTKAAIQGNAQAQFNLGVRYATGEGISKDFATAVEWWTKAAIQGNAQARQILVKMGAFE